MNKKFLNDHQGFSLLEIMVVLVLLSFAFASSISSFTQTQRQKLEQTVDDFDRAIRFAQNESILRNAIVRLNILIDKEPIEYNVQFGPGRNLVLPTVEDASRMGLKERDEQRKKQSDLDGQFNNVEEFSSENKVVDENVRVLGLASTYLKSIQTEGSLSIYFYPTGEKDEALIYFSTQEEMATLEVPAFESQTYIDFYPYSESELATLDNSQQDKMKELYEKWLKE